MNSDINNNSLSAIISLLDDTPKTEHASTIQDANTIAGNNDDSQNKQETPKFSMPDLLSLIDMASDLFGGNDEDTKNRLALLSALDPFIKTERKDKLNMAKTIVKISGLAKNFTNK